MDAEPIPLRLALYSDQLPGRTDEIDRAVMEWLPRTGARIGYLPSSPDRDRRWFASIREYYSRYGVETRFFGLEDEYTPVEQSDLLQCDAIHLTGGNTFRFLYWLRERGMIQPLRRFAQSGRALIGVSAGAILLTPEVRTSLLCGDVPYRGVQAGEGLSLVPFQIVPHDDGSVESSSELLTYSQTFDGTVYAIPDGGAVVVDGDRTMLFGEVRQFCAGLAVPSSPLGD